MNRLAIPGPPWWRRQLTWGIAASLALVAISMIADHGDTAVRLSAMLGITGLTLTLAIDVYFRLAEIAADRQRRESALLQSQRELATTLTALGPLVDSSEACRTFVLEVAGEWKQVERQNSLLHRRILEDQQLKFRSRLRALSNGQVAMDRESFLEFRSLSLSDLRSMHGISATNPAYWRNRHGVQYLAKQRAAITEGLEVERILVLSQRDLGAWSDVVRRQLDAGVRLAIVIRERVERDDLRLLNMDRFVITDKGGVRGALFHSPQTDAHRLTNDESEIHETEQILATMRIYAQPPDHIFPTLNP